MRYVVGIFMALLALGISIAFSRAQDIRSLLPEQHWDWYMGYALGMYRGQGYVDCLPHRDNVYNFECRTPPHLSADKLPGYPVYLTLNLILFGDRDPVAAIRLLQSVLAAMIVFMTTMLASRIANIRVAIIAGALMVTTLPLYQLAYLLFSEVLFTFLLFMSLCSRLSSSASVI